ncbi:inositol monophosphatase family protein [uncultured Algimonas sp.]|uniref:inositol monophosphatase family protein n=1 Tax=uncultured Algimonas sp. TaxID=1547920 RepID=UPI00262774A2|nr:inositol monophosphatase family protein [uncultured Algimonas sp.]
MPGDSDTEKLDRDDLALLERTVREAGRICLDHFNRNEDQVWDKGGNHPVTDADIAVNDYLHATLTGARPGYGWLSEETADDRSRLSAARTFVVDPIDGTRAFIDRKPGFAISVAITEGTKAVAGCVINPLKDEFYAARRGGGATLNGNRLHVRDCTRVGGCTMVGYPRKFKRAGFPDMRVRISNSMAYRMVMVAGGHADATVSFTPKSDWDVAAAALIATEAGATVTDLYGHPPRYGGETTRGMGVICASPPLHALLMEQLKPVTAKLHSSKAAPKHNPFLGTTMSDRDTAPIQLLHLVIGGELVDPNKTTFKDLAGVDFVGAYANYAEAHDAWKSAAQRTVDNAHARYFILHAHELIDPDKDGVIG